MKCEHCGAEQAGGRFCETCGLALTRIRPDDAPAAPHGTGAESGEPRRCSECGLPVTGSVCRNCGARIPEAEG